MDNHVIALHLDRTKRLWVATAGGLFRSAALGGGLRFERMLPPGSTMHGTSFIAFWEIGKGECGWAALRVCIAGTASIGVFFPTSDGLLSSAVTHVAQTGDGAIWVGYREPLGLSRLAFSDGKINATHFFRTNDGIASGYVLFLGLDAANRLWIGADNGVNVGSGTRRFTMDARTAWYGTIAPRMDFLRQPTEAYGSAP